MCKHWEDINVTCPSISLGVATPHFWLLSKFLHHIRVQVRCWAGNSWYPSGRATLIFSALLHNPCLLLTTIKEMLKFYQNMIPSMLDLSVKPSKNLTPSTLGFNALFPQRVFLPQQQGWAPADGSVSASATGGSVLQDEPACLQLSGILALLQMSSTPEVLPKCMLAMRLPQAHTCAAKCKFLIQLFIAKITPMLRFCWNHYLLVSFLFLLSFQAEAYVSWHLALQKAWAMHLR